MTMQVEERSKVEKGEFEFIKGEFSPSEALEIITHLTQEKINFLKIRNLSELIRSESGDGWCLERIEELKQSREAISILINEAKEQGKILTIQSNISIEVK